DQLEAEEPGGEARPVVEVAGANAEIAEGLQFHGSAPLPRMGNHSERLAKGQKGKGLKSETQATSSCPALCRASTSCFHETNRDRGEPRGSAPPTPPYVRVRIRRFGGV